MNNHPFGQAVSQIDGKNYFKLRVVAKDKLDQLPYATRIILESVIRNCDNFEITPEDVSKILNFDPKRDACEIPFKPARVLLQDFTGVPAAVDLASMRDAVIELGGKAEQVNPLVPVDLVIDHSVAVDCAGTEDSLLKNEEIEFQRNSERFTFLKWAQTAFKNMQVIPPGSGICHQVNLEYLGRVVCNDPEKNVIYPDSVVGTDSHTTMIAGAGIVGWGVGGIEAEAVMMGQPIYMLLPEVIEFNLRGTLPKGTTSTDLVLKIAEILRVEKVVGKIVEFTGYHSLSVADRATISNMSPEFGCTVAFFPADSKTIDFMRMTGRNEDHVKLVERYLKENDLFRTPESKNPVYSKTIELDLSTIEPSMAGPKRPHDYNSLKSLPKAFHEQLVAPIGFRGFGLPKDRVNDQAVVNCDGTSYTIRHGSVVLAAITSCTNTSNPSVMVAAGLLCKHAAEKGLKCQPFVKCSLSPGSHVVQEYLVRGHLYESMKAVGFYLTGFGCQTCIGNSGDLRSEIIEGITSKDLVACAVLSGNRNFEGRVNPHTRANYLASPPLVVAYALSGRIDIDWENEPLGLDQQGKEVYLRDLWPTMDDVNEFISTHVSSELFRDVYRSIKEGPRSWQQIQVRENPMCVWDPNSTYVHKPPFFSNLKLKPEPVSPIKNAYCLLNLGDSITTDHISPAGKIALNSPAAEYLRSRGVTPKMFNSYGSRRGHDEVMVRGTFANIRLVNKLCKNVGPITVHFPTGEELSVYNAAERYMQEGVPSVILAGAEYGCGSSRDWAAKGVKLLGVRAIIAKSYERIHRSNLVGMGILPLQFAANEDADSLGLSGHEKFTIDATNAGVRNEVTVEAVRASGETITFKTISRIDTPVELDYFKHGGILNYVLRKMATSSPKQ